METFREYVATWLTSTGTSATQLGERSGVDQSLLSKYLHQDPSRRVTPTPKSLQKLAPVLGKPYEDLMRMCGYLPGEASADFDAEQLAAHELVDSLMAAVEPEHRPYLLHDLKVHGDSMVALFRRLGTAVSATPDTAVNGAVSATSKADGRRRRGARGELGARYPQLNVPLASAYGVANGALAI